MFTCASHSAFFVAVDHFYTFNFTDKPFTSMQGELCCFLTELPLKEDGGSMLGQQIY